LFALFDAAVTRPTLRPVVFLGLLRPAARQANQRSTEVVRRAATPPLLRHRPWRPPRIIVCGKGMQHLNYPPMIRGGFQ
jgi:hypothetical protein